MKTIKMEVGNLGTNCYIIYCEKTLQAAIIDPGGNAQEIIALLNQEKLNVACIINTHGHADHILANTAVRQATGAPLYIHEADAAMLTNAQLNLSPFIGGAMTCDPADRLLTDGDIIQVGEIKFTVMHTPGHTPGGICLQTDTLVVSGDTLFAESIGRTDFPGGSHGQLINSIRNKLLILGNDVRVLPGHGPDTTIGWERANNPFIQ